MNVLRPLPLLVMIGMLLSVGCPCVDAHAEVVVVVSADSPATALSRDDLANLFLGRSNRFPDGSAAIPLDQAEGSAARAEFYSEYLARSAAQMKAHWSKIIFTGRGQPPKEVADDRAVLQMIAADPRLIGYVDAAAVDASKVRIIATVK
jgi:ABC-type phosphate transport system substrate-binding protein